MIIGIRCSGLGVEVKQKQSLALRGKADLEPVALQSSRLTGSVSLFDSDNVEGPCCLSLPMQSDYSKQDRARKGTTDLSRIAVASCGRHDDDSVPRDSVPRQSRRLA